ncbi:PAS domain S-box-containing protein [Singulisphaera sp. GP187]|uniref:PAS domain-containing protein n=1 Tax=Singulisphaera sp. GP187 TaxID=1882752 RepID=UPI000925F8F4|nr:PAS domain-containing protein [Singulisphaera sp. GP187]SIO44206.1 PAS domain S-box-containing protein [Singulisphaera sp. GP187]
MVPNSEWDRHADDTVFGQRDWLLITLASIGDGVITADRDGCVNYLNPVAEKLTGWTLGEAAGVEVEQVFRIINEMTKEPVTQPVRNVIERGLTVGLGNHTLLIARAGSERPIDDSAAAIKDDRGNVVGVVLIFRDITGRRQAELAIQSAKDCLDCVRLSLLPGAENLRGPGDGMGRRRLRRPDRSCWIEPRVASRCRWHSRSKVVVPLVWMWPLNRDAPGQSTNRPPCRPLA